MSETQAPIAFLFDVDNTLLDNDRVRNDLIEAIDRAVGAERGARFWEFYEEIRRACDYVDFPHTLERFTLTFPDERGFPALADAVLSYPYRSAAFPGAHEVLRRVGTMGARGDPLRRRPGLSARQDRQGGVCRRRRRASPAKVLVPETGPVVDRGQAAHQQVGGRVVIGVLGRERPEGG